MLSLTKNKPPHSHPALLFPSALLTDNSLFLHLPYAQATLVTIVAIDSSMAYRILSPSTSSLYPHRTSHVLSHPPPLVLQAADYRSSLLPSLHYSPSSNTHLLCLSTSYSHPSLPLRLFLLLLHLHRVPLFSARPVLLHSLLDLEI